ncbi:unnamed protein product [Oreochromis niloticus]|nr:unnamed protein product [Mustela putorius furo]
MKLELLVVVAVAVLLPSFSESRIVSKCELREKLGEMLDLPRRLEERTLATVICEVQRRSALNTKLLKSFGKCIPTTPKPAVVTTPSTSGGNNMVTGAATATNTNSTTIDLTNTTTATNTSTIPTTANSTISSGNTTFVSNSTTGMKRRRRDADSSSEKENKFSEEEHEDDSEMEDEDETSSEDDDESKNLYGLFQLSDREFCDSGYCPSKNMCHASCTAFTDDDITDDIACVVETGYWKEIMRSASDSCRRPRDFFEECD